MLTAEILRQELRYDLETGEFWWRIARRGRQTDRQAGTVGFQGRQWVRSICIDGVRYRAGRLAFLYVIGRWPDPEVDHINRNPLDNRWANLREATRSIQSINREPPSDRLRGASFHKPSGRWQACIKKDGKQIALGYYDTAVAAHNAYLTAARNLHGRFHVSDSERGTSSNPADDDASRRLGTNKVKGG